jgi:hypothetical protein
LRTDAGFANLVVDEDLQVKGIKNAIWLRLQDLVGYLIHAQPNAK